MTTLLILTAGIAGFAAGWIARGWPKPVLRTTPEQDRLMDPATPPPAGYGALLAAPGVRPAWLDPQEIVARHLPMGLSERKADFVTTWDHPFRLRVDHPHYSMN